MTMERVRMEYSQDSEADETAFVDCRFKFVSKITKFIDDTPFAIFSLY